MMHAPRLTIGRIAIGRAKIPMLIGMGVSAKADRVCMSADRGQEILYVNSIVCRIRRRERLQGNVEADHH